MDLMEAILSFIEQLKEKYEELIELDHTVKADPYANVGKWKVCEAIEKFIKKEVGEMGNTNGIEGFRLDSVELHFGRTVKTGDYENCRADLKVSGVVTEQKDISEVSSQLFQLLDKQVTEQLNRTLNGSQDVDPEPAEEPFPEASDNGKKATLKQYKCIWAIANSKGLERDTVEELLKERLGVSRCSEKAIVGVVDRGMISDVIEELQEAY